MPSPNVSLEHSTSSMKHLENVRFFKGCIHAIFQTGSYQHSVLFSSVFSIHKNKDIDLLGEIILYIPQWSLDVSIDIWYTQVIEFFCNKWKNNVLHCQKQQKDNFITKKMPRMPTRDTQFPVKSKLVWPYSLSDLPHQIENACSHLFLDSLHDISHLLLGLELAFINTTTGLLFKQHSFYVGQASH